VTTITEKILDGATGAPKKQQQRMNIARSAGCLGSAVGKPPTPNPKNDPSIDILPKNPYIVQ
jgi:hypothetical protein